jgi:hypothetical protein
VARDYDQHSARRKKERSEAGRHLAERCDDFESFLWVFDAQGLRVSIVSVSDDAAAREAHTREHIHDLLSFAASSVSPAVTITGRGKETCLRKPGW